VGWGGKGKEVVEHFGRVSSRNSTQPPLGEYSSKKSPGGNNLEEGVCCYSKGMKEGLTIRI